MKRWMTVAVTVIALLFALEVASPSTARASTQDILIYSGIAAGAAVVIVLIATYMTRDEGTIFLTEPQPQLDHPDDESVHFGTECRKPDGTISLLCW
jgi:hypothetical protein